MFLEISGRQTGKTTRLVEHATNQLLLNYNNNEYRIAVTSNSRTQSRNIKNKIGYKLREIVDNEYPQMTNFIQRLYDNIIVTTDMNTPSLRPNMWYVDEFAFISPNRLRSLDNTYFCTTPNGDNYFLDELVDFYQSWDVPIVSYDVSQQLRGEPALRDDVNMFDDYCIDKQLDMLPHPFEVIEGNNISHKKWVKKHKL